MNCHLHETQSSDWTKVLLSKQLHLLCVWLLCCTNHSPWPGDGEDRVRLGSLFPLGSFSLTGISIENPWHILLPHLLFALYLQWTRQMKDKQKYLLYEFDLTRCEGRQAGPACWISTANLQWVQGATSRRNTYNIIWLTKPQHKKQIPYVYTSYKYVTYFQYHTHVRVNADVCNWTVWSNITNITGWQCG